MYEWIASIQASIKQDSVFDAFEQRKKQKLSNVQGLNLPGFDWQLGNFYYSVCVAVCI